MDPLLNRFRFVAKHDEWIDGVVCSTCNVLEDFNELFIGHSPLGIIGEVEIAKVSSVLATEPQLGFEQSQDIFLDDIVTVCDVKQGDLLEVSISFAGQFF